MKNMKLAYLLSFSLLFVAFACNDDDFVEYGAEQPQVVTDAFIQIKTPVIAFQAGTPSYTMSVNVINGLKRITAVDAYMIFTDASTGMKSNEALLGSYSLDAGNLTELNVELTYDDLKSGLTVNDLPLPADEQDVAIGSGWVVTFIGKRAEGDIPLSGSVRIGVLSRFAGLYTVTMSEYYRIGVFSTGWNGQSRFIGSVDETTFSYNDFWGNFGWAGSHFNFRVRPDNTIQVPIIVAGLFSGNRAISCDTDAAIFTSVPCDGSNILIPDDVGGKHTIKLTYGYFTDGSGPREFYEVLVKQ
jgi:hypothetical protein